MHVGRHMATRYPMNWITRRSLHSAYNRFQAPENSLLGVQRGKVVNPVLGCPRSVINRLRNSPSEPMHKISRVAM